MPLNQILSCNFLILNTVVMQGQLYMMMISACRYVIKLYCECVNNNDGLCFMIFFVDFFFNTACIAEIKDYCTEVSGFIGPLPRGVRGHGCEYKL